MAQKMKLASEVKNGTIEIGAARIPMQQIDIVPVPVETTPENAKRLIKKWNATFEFDVEGLDALNTDQLMAELAWEYALFRSDRKRAPIVHTSENGVVYRPQHPYVIILEEDKQKWMLADAFWAEEKQRKAAGITCPHNVMLAAGQNSHILCQK